MTQEASVLLHIGLPKTGTTFLQEQIFPKLSGFDMPYLDDGELARALRDAVQENPLFRDLAPVAKQLAERQKRHPKKTLLISDERLIGASYFGFRDSISIAEALKELFPRAKILFVIRRQDEFVDSLYRQALHEYHSVPLATFLGGRGKDYLPDKPFRNILDRPFPHADLPVLDWSRYVDLYERLFGADNVLVLPYELLKADNRAFLDRIYAFIGAQPYYPEGNKTINRSYGGVTARIARFLNNFVWAEHRSFGLIVNRPFIRYTPQRYRSLIRKIDVESALTATVDRIPQRRELIDKKLRGAILARFAEANVQLDKRRDLGLAQFGYY
jgi:hypothetical protein